MQPDEARDTGFLDDMAMDTQPAFVDTQPMQRDWADIKAEMKPQSAQALPVGTWVDVMQDGQAMRCQITWASPHGTMFLFTVMSAITNAFSASFPVIPFERKSRSMLWLSVPPETML